MRSWVLYKGAAWALLGALTACRPAHPASTADQAQASISLPAQQLIMHQDSAPVVDLRLVFQAGSVDDPVGFEGLTQVMLTSMLEGRAGTLSYAERARMLYPMAAQLEGYVGREQFVISARVHRDHLQRFYPLLRDVLLAPAFDASDVERVRTRQLASLTQDLRGADDEELGKQTLQAMLYEGDRRAHPELGSESGLTTIQTKHVVEQWQRTVCQGRLTVAMSGPVDQAFVRTLRQDLGSLHRPECQAASSTFAKGEQRRRVWLVNKPEAQSVAISIGMPLKVTRNHPDYAALTLAAAYLGQHRTFAGRLMQKMRELRGLNYGDYAYAEHFEQDGETRFPQPNVARKQQYFSLWLRPVPRDRAHFALRMALRELTAFVQQGLNQADFTRIQRFVDRYYALFAQTEQQRLGNSVDDRFYGIVGPHLDALRASFRALTREQVNAAIARHLSLSHLQVAMVAPDAEQLADALIKGEPSPITYSSEKPAALLEEDELIASFPLDLKREQLRVIAVDKLFY